jgi:hypothetical protein
VTAACIVTSRPSGHRCPDIGLDRGAMNIATISVEPNDSGEHPSMTSGDTGHPTPSVSLGR